MSIATEITRLQGIKTDIRTALVTQGIAQASSHNMADFSADILAIQGGSEGVYITVTCDSAYQGYDIILSANESELDRKQCPSSSIVNFFVSADNVTLPTTFTISNNHPDYSGIVQVVSASMYGWYETDLLVERPLVPKLTSNIGDNGKVIRSSIYSNIEAWGAFSQSTTESWTSGNLWLSDSVANEWIGYNFTNPKCVTKFEITVPNTGVSRVKNYKLQASNSGKEGEWKNLYSGAYPNYTDNTVHVHKQTIGKENIANTTKYLYYRILVIDTWSLDANISISNLQLYGY